MRKNGERLRRTAAATAQWSGARLLRANERAAKLIADHRFSWCRARLLHALAGAAEQGKLVEVLLELLAETLFAEEASDIAAGLVNVLRTTGWLRTSGAGLR